ncbi:glycogen synthase [Salsuginibacillus kocurii]|uniref:glycogen synthase n=1 Tax=Salsuginibacillus kocurii TaxID=427078 RepID=UPI000362DD0D|nr:glycogen synthase [Salsuginibacillus kocurii]
MKQVLFAASEATPFIKTGGLGDVAGSLPHALNQTKEVEVAVVLPLYRDIGTEWRKKLEPIRTVPVRLGWRYHEARLLTYVHQGIRFYFIENDFYFGREGIYGYLDDGERFVFYNKAIEQALPYFFKKPDIIHAHDWQTSLLLALLKTADRPLPVRSVLTIHNLQFQGKMHHDAFDQLIERPLKHFDGFEWDGMINLLKAGLFHADQITTVSPSYAEEIKTSYYGEGLHPVLNDRAYDLTGILNGIDTESYNPSNDKALPVPYQNEREGKLANKTHIQELLGLPVNKDLPLYLVISRLTDQKGFHLLTRIAGEFLQNDVQLVVLGTGEEVFESAFQGLADAYSENMAVRLAFDETLARKLYAGADFFIMPSKFEPCGLAQLIALQYKTAPIVRETGGLRDTIQPYNEYEGSGNGFSFNHFNAHELLHVLLYSLEVYNDPERFNTLYTNLTGEAFSWQASANAYASLYLHALAQDQPSLHEVRKGRNA